MIDYNFILNTGITISSSGTSGDPTQYFQPPSKLKAANIVARDSQHITNLSKIYTCCKLTHAGGLLAQTLPALEIGAEVCIKNFSAYDFIKDIPYFTHTHLTPLHAKAIMLTKGFEFLNFKGIWITCGAEPVSWQIIESFVSKGATFMVNWGMSEIGPIAINTVFDDLYKVIEYKEYATTDISILGDNFYCDYKIENGELVVKGDICVFDGWYNTKDKVKLINDILFYQGRTNKDIDIWVSQKK